MSFDLKSRWQHLGKVDKCFAILVPIEIILDLAFPASIFRLLTTIALMVLGGWIVLRLARAGSRKAIWRLRNRLLVTYLLIAVVPILLIFTLAGLGTYALGSQIAVYLARSELDRRVASMRAVTEILEGTQSPQLAELLRQTGEVYRGRFPDLSLLISERGSVHRWPDQSTLNFTHVQPGEHSGVSWRNGRFYAWSHVSTKNGMEFIAATPLTRRYLSSMVPGLGEVYLLGVRLKDGSIVFPSGHEASGTALPPATNRFDLDFLWGSVVPIADRVDPAQADFAMLWVNTRLSAILQVIFSRQVDELQVLLPILYGVAIAFLIVAIVGLVIGVSLTRTITGAVHALYEGTQRIMEGDFSHRIAVSGREQLGALSTSFNTMTENLERLLVVAKEKERLQAEIEIAREVQEQLYPKKAPVLKHLRIEGCCHPARMVSGDYYDYQALTGNKLAFAIGDVAGKGISAALLMATIQSAMRMELRALLEMGAPAPVNGFQLSTARLVGDLNRQLHATTSAEKFATFYFALYDDETGIMTYTNAGHPPPVVVREGGFSRLDVNGTVVGAFAGAQYEESRLQLESGDLLVCYTDGITEPENEYGEMFGEERLIELISKNLDRDERKIIDTLMDAVRQWTGAPELPDDMTVVLARKG